jgi:hypothetical protein
MLNEEQQATEVTLTGGQVIIALQVISRLVSSGGLKDMELSPVGDARDGMVAALEAATDVNFDAAKAQQEAMQRQRIAQAREAHAKAQQEAADKIEAPAVDLSKESAEAPAETVEIVEAPAGNSHAADVEVG